MLASYARLARRAAAPGAAVASVALWSETRLAGASASTITSKAVASTTSRLLTTINTNKSTCSAATCKRLFSSSSSSSSATTSTNTGFVAWYEGHLSRQPVLTKAVTGSLLWSIGDAVAQCVPDMAAGNPLKEYDWARTGRACFYGFAIHAPLSHMHFNFLEYLTVKGGFKGLQITVFKTVMEQFVYWSWVSNCLYHGAMGAMQGQSPSQTWDYIKSVIWDTQKAQWIFWIPVQLLNFNFIPVRHQLNVVLGTSIVWTALLSMWYPPLADDKEEQKLDELPIM